MTLTLCFVDEFSSVNRARHQQNSLMIDVPIMTCTRAIGQPYVDGLNHHLSHEQNMSLVLSSLTNIDFSNSIFQVIIWISGLNLSLCQRNAVSHWLGANLESALESVRTQYTLIANSNEQWRFSGKTMQWTITMDLLIVLSMMMLSAKYHTGENGLMSSFWVKLNYN